MFGSKSITAEALHAAADSQVNVIVKLVPKSTHVHLNDEAPFSFKVTLPESSTIVNQPALNLEEGTASFDFKFGGVAGEVKVATRLFFCADAGQCVSEGVDFIIPVHSDGSATTHTVVYEYDIETKKKFTIF